MIEYKWRIDPLMVENNVNGFENVVIKVTWVCEAVDGELQAISRGYVPVEFQDPTSFKPFHELTEADVWGWVAPHLDKTLIEEGLATAIDGQKHPKFSHLQPPWSQL